MKIKCKPLCRHKIDGSKVKLEYIYIKNECTLTTIAPDDPCT